MHRDRRWVRTMLVVMAVAFCGSLAVSCGGGAGGGAGSGPQTGVIVKNNATNQFGLSNAHPIKRVDIGGAPANVHIPPGQSLFMPTTAGNHTVNVLYTDNSGEWGQNPIDAVTVAAGQVVTITFVN